MLAAAGALGALGMRAYAEVSGQTGRYGTYKALQRDAGKADSLSAAYEAVL